ncbi:MAG: ABC transporter permease [Lachnospiraceae bacterium]|nr:ABC transporter permease [Lachnospiraceae bacterium]
MKSVLKKIPVRKAIREKGKSFCVILAVFFTTVLFVMVFSTLFFVVDAAEEMMRAASPMLADAAFVTTGEEYDKVCKSKRVEEAGMGIRFGETIEPTGVGGILLFDFEDKMAQWMKYYPVEGRMPQKGNEIVISDQYLKDCGLTYKADEQIELTYYIEDEEYTDTFTIVGKYEMSGQPLHVILTSDEFYREVCEQLEQRGINPEDAAYQITGVIFSSRGNVRRQASMLIAEEGLDIGEEEVFMNDVSLFDGIGIGTWVAIAGLLLFVMMIGYLFISNIFQISISGDARFYGKLSTNGVTKKEIQNIVRRKNNILFLISAIPALLAGYVFAAAILPGILSAYATIQIKRSGNAMIFVFALAFSYATVKVSERKSVRLAKNASPIEMKRYTGKLKPVKTADNKDCLRKFVVRNFKRDKAKVLKVCISVALSILLANAFYAVAAGFDEEEYVKSDLDADFIIAKEPIFTSSNVNAVSYLRTTEEEIAAYRELPGIKEEGGAAMSHICIHLSEQVWDNFVKIAGADYYDTPGEMWTAAYGVDDMMLRRLKPIKGEIDTELFHTGSYVLIDPIMGDNNMENAACYEPGDQVTIPFRSGEEKTYTVMAVVEGLHYSLAFPGRYWGSQMYLPMEEWQEKEKRNDYYLYAFDVEEKFHEVWDDALENSIKEKDSRLAYRSAKTAGAEAKSYVRGLKLAGVVLSMILLSMGILNFINCMVGSVYSRGKEFAILQSMGMEEQEIRKSLAKEGMLYMAGGFVPGVLMTVPGVWVLIEKLLLEPYIKYHFYPVIYLMFAVLGCAVAVLVPWAAYKMMDRKDDFLHRIRALQL